MAEVNVSQKIEHGDQAKQLIRPYLSSDQEKYLLSISDTKMTGSSIHARNAYGLSFK